MLFYSEKLFFLRYGFILHAHEPAVKQKSTNSKASTPGGLARLVHAADYLASRKHLLPEA